MVFSFLGLSSQIIKIIYAYIKTFKTQVLWYLRVFAFRLFFSVNEFTHLWPGMMEMQLLCHATAWVSIYYNIRNTFSPLLVWAAVTKRHTLGDLKQTLISHCSGVWQVQDQVLADSTWWELAFWFFPHPIFSCLV